MFFLPPNRHLVILRQIASQLTILFLFFYIRKQCKKVRGKLSGWCQILVPICRKLHLWPDSSRVIYFSWGFLWYPILLLRREQYMWRWKLFLCSWRELLWRINISECIVHSCESVTAGWRRGNRYVEPCLGELLNNDVVVDLTAKADE